MLKKYFLPLFALIHLFSHPASLQGTLASFPYTQSDQGPYTHYTLEYLQYVKQARLTLREKTTDIDQGLTQLSSLSGYPELSKLMHNFYSLHAATIAQIEAKRSQLPPRQNRGMSLVLTPEIKLGATSSKVSTMIKNFNDAVIDVMNGARATNPPHVNYSDSRITSAISTLTQLAQEVDTIIAAIDTAPQKPQVSAPPKPTPAFTLFSTSTPPPSVHTTSSSRFSQRTSNSSASSSFTFSRPSTANTASASSSSSSSSSPRTKSSSSQKSPPAPESSSDSLIFGAAVAGISVAAFKGGKLFNSLYTEIRSAEPHLRKKDAAIQAFNRAVEEVKKEPLQHKMFLGSALIGIVSAAASLLK